MSSCGQNEDDQQFVQKQQKEASQRYSDLPAGSWRVKTDTFGEQVPNCIKCKENRAQISANQREPMCYECLHDQLIGKVRKMKGMLEEGDKILVAISGGPSSLAMLSLLNSVCNRNPDRPERRKVRFQIVPIYINPVSNTLGHAEEVSQQNNSICEIVQQILGGDNFSKQDLTVNLQQLYEEEEDKLAMLLQATKESTGREDLLDSLKMHLLLKVAREKGCNKIARGVNATLISSRIIADTAKGRGMAIPDQISHLDKRHSEISIISPVGEISAKELSLLCRFLDIKYDDNQAFQNYMEKEQSLNSLSASFMCGLITHLPSSAYTVLRSVQKLQGSEYGVDLMCGICSATISDIVHGLVCCRCCSRQILNLDGMMSQTDTKQVIDNLPQVIVRKLYNVPKQRSSGPINELQDTTNLPPTGEFEDSSTSKLYEGWNRNHMKEEIIEFSYESK